MCPLYISYKIDPLRPCITDLTFVWKYRFCPVSYRDKPPSGYPKTILPTRRVVSLIGDVSDAIAAGLSLLRVRSRACNCSCVVASLHRCSRRCCWCVVVVALFVFLFLLSSFLPMFLFLLLAPIPAVLIDTPGPLSAPELLCRACTLLNPPSRVLCLTCGSPLE
jgi:hypothetical protein